MSKALATEQQRRDNARQQLALVKSLRQIRQDNKLSVQDVADYMKVDASMVYRFEKGGTNFTMGTARKYAAAVGASLSFTATNDAIIRDNNVAHSESIFIINQALNCASVDRLFSGLPKVGAHDWNSLFPNSNSSRDIRPSRSGKTSVTDNSVKIEVKI